VIAFLLNSAATVPSKDRLEKNMAIQATIAKFRAMLSSCPWLLESKNIVHVPFKDPNAPKNKPSQTLPGVTWPELEELLDYAADQDELGAGAIAAARPESAARSVRAIRPVGGAISNVSDKEVKDFSEHCVFIRSVYVFAERLFRHSDSVEHALMGAIAPRFFEDLSNVFGDYVVIAACRITDPAKDRKGNENFTIEMLVNHFAPHTHAFKQLDALHQRMKPFRTKIVPARNKLAAHTDRTAVSGPPLGTASWEEWAQFWSALRDFVRILNEKTTGRPFEIDAAGVFGDAEMLLKALGESRHFETLLNGNDPVVKAACLKAALPKA
jgi:hypothetical protein